TATLAQWEAALRAVTYTNTSQTPNTSTRTISFVVNDGTSNSNTATKDVSVTAVNDTPVVNAPAVIQVIEDVITVLTGISFSDQDAGSGQVTANFAVPSGTLYATSGGVTVLGSGTGNLTLSGSVADINTFIASNNLSFQTTPNNTATVPLTIGINDNGNSGGSAQTNSTTVNLQVISVADVINVTSPTANGHYKAGDVITVTVQFDEPVFVNTSGGIPDLVLETGTIDRNAVYTSGSGTSTLTFTYTVQPGDTTPDLDYVSSISLGLNGGTIQNNTAINATLALPNPGTTGSLGANKEIVIDTTPPSVGPIDITNGTDSGTNDTITNNGSPVIIFTGETGLTISLLGADGSILLTPVTQYTVIETPNGNGTSTYTVTLLDANGNLNDGNQPFGTYLTTFPNIGNPTNNGGSVADGIYTIKATDIAGNQSTVGTFTIDTTPPGLSPGVGPINITNGTDSGPDDTITNNGNPVLTFTGEQGLTITLYGPDGTQLIFGTHYTFSYTSGTYTVNLLDAVPGGQANTFGSFNNGAPTGNLPSVADGLYTIKATDVAGNQSTVGTFTIDTTAPSVVVTSNLSTLVSNQTATITFTFSENPIGFTNTDVIVNGGTISGFTSTADPKVYSGIFTPSPNSTANGTISVSIGSYTDLANNPGASDSTSIMVDTLGPSLAISSDKPELEYHQTAAITFSFSELPVGFDLVDITLTGGTLSNLKASPINQTIYTALFTPTIDFCCEWKIHGQSWQFRNWRKY
ncbi:MAG: hypothetical protein EBT92_17255, partial [Planctomycetes bacterium]|nr:hypothetical protein [Planctomycetota bacterium]